LSLHFSISEVTLSGLAGGEYFPLPASKGLVFPLRSAESFGLSSGSKTHVEACLPSMGTPPLQEFALRNNGVLQKLRKLQIFFCWQIWNNLVTRRNL